MSIISLTYQHEAFIEQHLESILAQTFRDWELIYLDDGSTDSTCSLIEGRQDPRIRLMRQPHAGIGSIPRSYQRGLELTKAPLVAFIDGDDYWAPDHLERLVPAFQDPGVVLAFSQTRVLADPSLGQVAMYPPPQVTPAMLRNDPVGSAALAMLNPTTIMIMHPLAAIMRRSALDRIGGVRILPGVPVIDYPTILEFTVLGRFFHSESIGGYWRVHGKSVSQTEADRIFPGLYSLMKEFRRLHEASLPFSPQEWQTLDVSWRGIPGLDPLLTGRRLVADGYWKEGRKAFSGCLRRTPWRRRVQAMLGLCLSGLHLTMENLYRGLARPYFRRREDGRVDFVMPKSVSETLNSRPDA